MAETIHILDCTLRDGSYAIDFQFTAEDTALIASALESSGIRFIELGHGLGLGAAGAGKGDQADSDEAYVKAAAHVLKAARFGAFFIPGVGAEDDLRAAAELGMQFVRIGTNVTEVDEAEPYARLAKDLGLTVFANLMKSYAVPAKDFAECARKAEGYGADVVVLVDSAGGMLQEDVRSYLEAAREACHASLGFHGHDNLCMAVANTVEAADSGAAFLDASLQGIGRSEGNAPTEVLASVLQRRGHVPEIDVNGLLDVSEAFIRPLVHREGRSSMGVTAGRARFHSSFLGQVMSAAARFGVDARELVLRLGERETLEAPSELVTELAAELAERGPRPRVRVDFAATTAEPPQDFEGQAHVRVRELRQQAKKLGLPSVLNVVVTRHEVTAVSPYVETRYGCAVANIMIAEPDLLESVLSTADGVVDYVLLDAGEPALPDDALKKSALLTYVDHDMWAGATIAQVTLLLGGVVSGKVVVVTGVAPLVARAAMAFAEQGADVRLDAPLQTDAAATLHCTIRLQPLAQAISEADAVVCLSPRRPTVSAAQVDTMRPGALLFDGGIGSLAREAVPAAEKRGVRVVRVDMRPSLAAAALERIGMGHVVKDHMGRDTWNGVPVVAGGLIGREGEVIVDSIHHPSRIIGLADGKGGILQVDPNDERARNVRKAIAERLLEPDA